MTFEGFFPTQTILWLRLKYSHCTSYCKRDYTVKIFNFRKGLRDWQDQFHMRNIKMKYKKIKWHCFSSWQSLSLNMKLNLNLQSPRLPLGTSLSSLRAEKLTCLFDYLISFLLGRVITLEEYQNISTDCTLAAPFLTTLPSGLVVCKISRIPHWKMGWPKKLKSIFSINWKIYNFEIVERL